MNSSHLIWIDLEMTGLRPEHDRIIEIATIVTDASLQELAVGPEIVIATPANVLEEMDEWNRTTHGLSGLVERCLASPFDVSDAEDQTMVFLEQWVEAGSSPMCGNSICQDRRFLARWMPRLEGFFHYRNLDVSTLKELARRWAPEIAAGVNKSSRHRALDDIRQSIDELRYYRRHMGDLAGL